MSAAVRFANPDSMLKPPGYTQLVEMTGPGRTIWIAGQLGLDRQGKLAADFRAQAVQVFENLNAALTAAGATFADVVKLNNYLLDMRDLPVFRDVRDSYLNTAAPPASTTIAISALAREGALLEVEAVAVLPPR